jgi:hypothetical protein
MNIWAVLLAAVSSFLLGGSLESAQRLGFYRVDGLDVARLRFGEETHPMVTPGHGLCERCSAAA